MENLKYVGTRNKNITATASQAILKGICDDGGLFIPEKMPKLDKTLEQLSELDYKGLAYEILKLFLTDYTEEELKYCINGAYDEKFDTPEIAPVVKKADVSILELFHGKTIAFKDMALSILPYLMKTAAKKNGIDKKIVILTATSGDTGKAALEGFANVEGIKIIVFFPEDGVSPVQKLQMVTQEGSNTCVAGINGNFDDAQTAVKTIFTDKELEKELNDNGFMFSSANSINIGRLLPQVVYYFQAYIKMAKMGEIKLGDKINVVVPTGNFGNILAGYFAKQLGLPVKTFICASNINNVLYDFFKTGTYDKNRKFNVTMSPSMDILISSNLERLICMSSSQEKTKELMESLSKDGKYTLDLTNGIIKGEYATEEETAEAIKYMYQKSGYVMDTHTAVAYASYEKYKKESNDNTPTVIVSTASPYKFTKDVLKSIDKKYADMEFFPLMKELEKISGVKIPEPIKDIESKPILHKNVIEKNEIKEFIKKQLIK
ncbi:MAG: threonine synthase [Clostridia bacterium]|jgi:threonine synthase|nr:threonine synthase [Clostridia bacterium]